MSSHRVFSEGNGGGASKAEPEWRDFLMRSGEHSAQRGVSTILIADDHPFVLEFLADFCKGKWPDAKVEKATNFNEVLTALDRVNPQIVIMDFVMPEGSALDAVAEIVQRLPDAKVIFFSGMMSDEDAIRALRSGAAGYISKEEGVAVIDRVADLIEMGGTYAPVSIIKGALGSDPSGSASSKELNELSASLSSSDRELLRLIVSGQSNKIIASNLGISIAAVKQMARGVFKKLNVTNRTQAAVVALKLGISTPNLDE